MDAPSRAQTTRGDKMRKSIFRMAAFVFAAIILTQCVCAAPELSAGSAVLVDADTGEVLYAQNSREPSLIASTTKIMTALVVLEHCPLRQEVTVPPQAVGIEGSSVYLQAGECLTVEALLYGMMLCSGNDAATALALACGGSEANFVAMMNAKARELGLEDTSFANPHGLDSEKNYSTAADLAALTAHCLLNEDFVRIVSTKTATFGGRTFTNHNRLLWMADGILGVKTGYTKAAGRILVSAAERNGRRLIAVTVRDGNDWEDHCRLYDYGFARYTPRTVISAGTPVATVTLMDGTRAELLSAQDVTFAGTDALSVDVRWPQVAFSVGDYGSEAGWAVLRLGQRCVATVRLLWGGLRIAGENTEAHCRTRADVPTGGGETDR